MLSKKSDITDLWLAESKEFLSKEALITIETIWEPRYQQ